MGSIQSMLQVALVSWAMQRVSAVGFMPHGTPDLVRATVLEKCGFQPRGDNTQVGTSIAARTSASTCCTPNVVHAMLPQGSHIAIVPTDA